MTIDPANGFLTLSDATLADLGISTVEIADRIEGAIRDQVAGRIWTAPKSVILPGDGRYMMTTLSAADDPQITTVKSVIVSPRNPARGLPGIEGLIVLQDSETGQLLCVMQSGWITGVRTAGLSAVVARRLANPAARSIAFVGAGVQARSHLKAMADLFPLQHVAIVGRGQANIDRLVALAHDMGLTATVHTDPEPALKEADIVVTSVTLSFDIKPFLDARWLKPGAFATITDAGTPWHPDGMPAFSTLCIDDFGQEKASAKKMVAADLISTDLNGLVGGDAPFAFDPSARSAFVFRGIAIGDFAVASLAYRVAVARGLGTPASW